MHFFSLEYDLNLLVFVWLVNEKDANVVQSKL